MSLHNQSKYNQNRLITIRSTELLFFYPKSTNFPYNKFIKDRMEQF